MVGIAWLLLLGGIIAYVLLLRDDEELDQLPLVSHHLEEPEQQFEYAVTKQAQESNACSSTTGARNLPPIAVSYAKKSKPGETYGD